MYKSELIDLIADVLGDSDYLIANGIEDVWISNGKLFVFDDEGITYELMVEEV